MKWIKLITLDNRFQADLLTHALEQRGIPFLLREYKDTAYDGLFVTQKGWGTVMVDDTQLEEAKTITKELFCDQEE
jgi:deoxyribose-phosphate aldolase